MEPAQAIEVEVGDLQGILPISRSGVARCVRRALESQGITRAEISVVIMDDAGIRSINKRCLGHDWETDVITFPLSDPDQPTLAGELVISAQTAQETARELGVEPESELALYLVHGLLHLLGRDDQTPAGTAEMRAGEAEILHALGPALIRGLAPEPGQIGD